MTIAPCAAFADPGHIIASGGHDHWAAGIALGAAIAVVAWGWLKGRDEDAEDGGDAIDGDEAEA